MWALINPSRIISAHFKSLSSDAGKFPRYTIFFFIPLLSSFFLTVILEKPLTHEAIAVLVPAFAIFTALLLNVAFLLLNSVAKLDKDLIDEESLRGRLIRSLYINSLYAILVSTIILGVLILTEIAQPWFVVSYQIGILDYFLMLPSIYVLSFISFVEYALIVHFILNLLMVIKRLHGLLIVQIESSS